MSPQSISNPRAWSASSIDNPRAWYIALSDSSLAALDRFEHERNSSEHVTKLRSPDWLRAACKQDVDHILEALENGRGYAIVTAGAPGRYSPERLRTNYWLLGDMLGRPMEQNVQGTLLYDVRDTGQDVRYGARFSVTNAESTFHTDNSFGAEILDYVGLLCLNSAKSGGESQIVSAYAVQNELKSLHRNAWEILRQPFHIDRRGGVKEGDEPTVQFPILADDGSGLVIRYLRYWIEVGHEKAGVPLTSQQIAAMDILDRVAGQKELRVQFMMQPGEMQFINNRWLLHNRTAFDDHAEPEKKRHLVRLWIQR